MNKRGVLWETLADVFLAGFILLIGITFFFLLNGLHKQSLDTTIENKVTQLNEQESLISFLRADMAQDTNLAEMIIIAKLKNNHDQLEQQLDSFLEKIYGSKVCWELYQNDQKWIKKNRCKNEKVFLDSSTVLPMPNKDTVNIRLHIGGYAE